jgi:fimbrial chaperone protein
MRNLLLLLIMGCLEAPGVAHAGAISIAPVTIEITARADAATSLTVTNAGTTPANVQARVMHWTQVEGREQLTATDDVAVSPPIIQIPAGKEQVIRIVRLSKQPINGEEAYRILVDELPASTRSPSTSVNLIVRQSIPVFFRSAQAKTGSLAFSVRQTREGEITTANNDGDVHQKITSLTIRDSTGIPRFSKSGLVGYVLGHARLTISTPAMASRPGSIEATTERGIVRQTVSTR